MKERDKTNHDQDKLVNLLLKLSLDDIPVEVRANLLHIFDELKGYEFWEEQREKLKKLGVDVKKG